MEMMPKGTQQNRVTSDGWNQVVRYLGWICARGAVRSHIRGAVVGGYLGRGFLFYRSRAPVRVK